MRKNSRYVLGSIVATTVPEKAPRVVQSGRPSGRMYCVGSVTVRNGLSNDDLVDSAAGEALEDVEVPTRLAHDLRQCRVPHDS